MLFNAVRTIHLPTVLFLATLLMCPPQGGVAQDVPEKQFLFQSLAALKTGEVPSDKIDRLTSMAQGSSRYAKVASQTASFAKIHKGQYAGLWPAISKAIQESSAQADSESSTPQTMSWANHRLLLYLAMEAHRSKQASELIESAVKRSLQISDEHVALGRLDAEFLGVICALAKSDMGKDPIAPEFVSKATELMSKHPRKSLATAFNEAYEKIAKQLAHLESSMKLVETLSDSDLGAELSKAKLQFQNASDNFKESSEGLAEGKKQSIALDKGIAATRKLCAQIYQTLNNTQEPGKPEPPVPPRRPETKTKRDSKGNVIDEDRPSQSQINEYNREYQKYLSDKQSYPIRLAEWARRNEARQQRLASELMEARTKLVGLESSDKEQTEKVRQLTATNAQKQQLFVEAQRHLQGVEFAQEHRRDPENFKGIYRPSLYRSIDWASESDRLLKELR
ncbi:MAG: hypothetical protein LW850_15490 [Planctomycetaceae bacterium]|jgi:hypothetical protein|nr:hypothetical protein [Planctomycetaceae bacterium]